MARQVVWFMLTTDRGGLLRANVQESVKRGKSDVQLPGQDVDAKLSDFTKTEREVLLDAFAIVAEHFDADAREVQDE